MSGLIVVRLGSALGEVIEDMLLILETSHPEELENQVVFLPLK